MNTKLTNREYQMVELTAFGMAQKEIADHLQISSCTVDVTIRHAKEKLHVQKSTELAAWYFIKKYHISIDLAPVTRAIISLSFLGLVSIGIFSGFRPERVRTSPRADRAPISRQASRTRRNESALQINFITA